MTKPDKIYIVMVNSDTTEGRGPMVARGGFFLDEDKAWEYADTIPGCMGRKPEGSWKDSGMGDVQVEVVYSHEEIQKMDKAAIEKKIKELQDQLGSL